MQTVRNSDLADGFVASIEDVPSLPLVVQHILRRVEDPDAGFEDVSIIIEKDPGFSARLLKIANSAYFGSFTRVGSIEGALGRLGLAQVRDIALTAALVSGFERLNRILDMETFWKHSLSTAAAGCVISRNSPVIREVLSFGSNPFYICGLVHHLGILVEAWKDSEMFQQVRLQSWKEKRPLFEVELEHHGFSHAHVGGALLRRWNLPENIVDAVTWHHGVEHYAGNHRMEVLGTHLTAYFCYELGQVETLEGTLPWFDEKLWQEVGLAKENIPDLRREVEENIRYAMKVFEALKESA